MGVVSTIPEKCKRCYTCVRECPAKAIKVEHGQATVIEERCIACGNCVRVCAQNAKAITDCTPRIWDLLAGKERVFACLAPSFPAAFHPTPPGKIISAVRRLGFTEVWEVAFGAELVSRAYSELFRKAKQMGRQVIATSCPAIVAYVENYMPSLHHALAPIVSPMIAVARAIRHRHGHDTRIVFMGPCIAKKNEFRDANVEGDLDGVITFTELQGMFQTAGIDPRLIEQSFFDGPRCHLARSFPISGGLLKSAGLSQDILENDIVVTDGKNRVLAALEEVDAGCSQARLFDVLFCNGCINGPVMLNDLSPFARKEIVADFVNECNRHTTQRETIESLAEFEGLDLTRAFTLHDLKLRQPTVEEIEVALASMHKYPAENQLNCGACGYPSCREKAIAVCQGLAEPEMCLPYLVEELEATCERLQRSHEELASAQNRLVHTERLASMGQLSAGVAHEINNPLGTILLFSHILLKELNEQDSRRPELQMIVKEASRCKDIVRGLLDFARQSRVSKEPTNLAELIREVIAIMTPKAEEAQADLSLDLPNDLPTLMIDGAQIKQMMVNLVGNGIDAVPPGGRVAVRAHPAQLGSTVEIRVTDNGCGIPREDLPKVFTPFFTTKAMGKGTGLGLAIAYGIVKMHSGEISVASEVNKGSTFVVRLPVGQADDGHIPRSSGGTHGEFTI
jgi:two-component system, NtrC family, sensor kinase